MKAKSEDKTMLSCHVNNMQEKHFQTIDQDTLGRELMADPGSGSGHLGQVSRGKGGYLVPHVFWKTRIIR